MKETYTELEIMVIRFDEADVITGSDDSPVEDP